MPSAFLSRQTWRTPKRRGATVIVMVFLMAIILGMIAFSVEVGRMVLLRSQVQVAVDAGALAATLKLAQDPTALEAAVAAAKQYIQMNRTGLGITIPEESITVDIGQWDPDTKTFTETNTDPNAVRVTGVQDKEPFFFGRVFGRTDFSAPAVAIASGSVGKLDVMMVLDLSGSMADEGRIQALRNSAPIFVETVESYGGDDQIGVMGLSAQPNLYNPVAYGHTGVKYQPAGLNPSNNHHVGVVEADLTDDYAYLLNFVLTTSRLVPARYKGIDSAGWTGTGAAVRDAAHYLTNNANARDTARKVIVLMSDGIANRPSNNGPGYARSMATYADGLNVEIYTISLGNQADLVLMQDIADATGGKHFDATGSGEAELTEALTNAFQQIANGLKRPQLVD